MKCFLAGIWFVFVSIGAFAASPPSAISDVSTTESLQVFLDCFEDNPPLFLSQFSLAVGNAGGSPEAKIVALQKTVVWSLQFRGNPGDIWASMTTPERRLAMLVCAALTATEEAAVDRRKEVLRKRREMAESLQ